MITDYNGFVPDQPAVNFPTREQWAQYEYSPRFLEAMRQIHEANRDANDSPTQKLVDEILEKQAQARIYVLEHLIKNPGYVATLDDFEVVFEDIQLKSDSDSLRELNETRIVITQAVRIRRKEDDGVSLGGDPRGEARED